MGNTQLFPSGTHGLRIATLLLHLVAVLCSLFLASLTASVYRLTARSVPAIINDQVPCLPAFYSSYQENPRLDPGRPWTCTLSSVSSPSPRISVTNAGRLLGPAPVFSHDTETAQPKRAARRKTQTHRQAKSADSCGIPVLPMLHRVDPVQ